MNSCFGGLFMFLIFLVCIAFVVKTGLITYMAGSLGLFNDLLEEVFKSLISILQGGVYIPDSNWF